MADVTYTYPAKVSSADDSGANIYTIIDRSETERRHAELRGWLLCFAAIVETLDDSEFIDSGIVDQAARRIREYFNE